MERKTEAAPEAPLPPQDEPKDRYLRLRIFAAGEPRASKDYVLKLDDGTMIKGTTSGDGLLVEKLPPTVRRLRLQLESADLGFDDHFIDLDALFPPAGLSGIQQRLQNKGFLDRISGKLDDATRAALSQFQERHGLKVTGEPDGDTKAKLEEVHGS